MLDHIILGCSDLDHGIAFVEERTGTRAIFGGVHPGRGTRNALLALGGRRYLEIMAPDPSQNKIQSLAGRDISFLTALNVPRLIWWAEYTSDIEALAKRLRQSGIPFEGPVAGSRGRPDGRVLNWKTLNFEDNRQGLLPFFIEWSSGSVHPSEDAPSGCHVEGFGIVDPNPEELFKTVQQLDLEVLIVHGKESQLHASIAGPMGKFEISS
jgi:hypothetical protein